ncbi:MAG TPA: substrate-binding domain-containing protein [Gammaproteobacteria bacterium]|nr:substrate-binding domain-containing protein [Gammaproteobacteria bacterium]
MSRRRLLTVLSWVAAVALPAAACGQDVPALSGPAFTDPGEVYDALPSGWNERPLQHPQWAEGADLAVTVDQQLYPLLKPWIAEYAGREGLRIAVDRGTCGISAGALNRQEVDVGGFCCPPSPTDRLPGLRFHTLGIGALALFVHPDNPVDDLTLEEARRIYRGEIRRWSEIDPSAPDRLIHPVARLHCKARPGHWRLVLDNEDLFSVRLREVGSIPDMFSVVTSDPAALGYETLWMVHRERDQGAVQVVTVDGEDPADAEAVAAHRYPLYRTFNVTTWTAPARRNDEARDLVQYLYKRMEQAGPRAPYHLVPAHLLRENGWQFAGEELIGEPVGR